MNDAALAHTLAEEAGAMLLQLRAARPSGGKALGAEGDRVANRFILDRLLAERPDDAILSEEEKDNVARCSISRVWVIDPLDGTREYGEGRNDWAVHVALAVEGRPVVGAVALPGLGLTLASDKPPALQPEARPLRMLVSRTRPAAEAVAVAEALGAELVPMGSAGAKAMAIVRGEADIYLHTGGQYEWDNCAPAAVALAAGLHVSRIDGSPLVYNCENPYLPDLLICHRERAPEILKMIAKYATA
ncbi:3'(2'),5'-bisphosphate nucleotidase CysQ [Sphingomonas cavernae]|nr:3'(2'),5'-bisphosphate nucleotidase CysQ [Sphingomonas cavernae]